MSANGLEVFDTTLHKTHIWLNDIKRELQTDDNHAAYRALRVTLHTIRDRLTVDEAAGLGAQLPMLIRGVYYEGWRPAGKPDKSINREVLLERVSAAFAGGNGGAAGRQALTPECIICAVLRTLEAHISPGEVDEVWGTLPKSMRELWPEPMCG